MTEVQLLIGDDDVAASTAATFERAGLTKWKNFTRSLSPQASSLFGRTSHEQPVY